MDAISKSGLIDPHNAGSFEKVGWDRCARTDKGVSAAINYISLNIRCVHYNKKDIKFETTYHSN